MSTRSGTTMQHSEDDATMTTTITTTITTTERPKRRRRRRPRPQHRSSSMPYCILSTAAAAAAMTTITTIPTITPTLAESSSYELFHTQNSNNIDNNNNNNFPFTRSSERYSKQDVDVTKLSTRCDSLDYITTPMNNADFDQNGFLSKDEYVTFTDTISGGWLTDNNFGTSFVDMPLSLQETYLILSCLCELYPNQLWGGKGCCENDGSGVDNTGIRTNGTGEGELPTKQERQYLIYVCGTMDSSLEYVGADLVMSATEMPMGRPTVKPKGRPTETPTPQPTPQPTKRPTAKPTLSPTNEPSKKPTVPPVEPGEPTRFPTTPEPSPPPTPEPTSKPTGNPIAVGPPTTPFPTEPPLPFQPVLTDSPTTKRPTTKRPTTTSPTLKATTNEPSRSPSEVIVLTASPTGMPTVQPTTSPSIPPSTSSKPTISPSPTDSPTITTPPTISPSPSASPTTSSSPTSSSIPTDPPTNIPYTGQSPALLVFVASLDGQVNAAEVMAGENNQVKVMMEEQLLILSNIVVGEEFGGDSGSSGGGSGSSTRRRMVNSTPSSRVASRNEEPKLRRRRGREDGRELIVNEAISVVVDSVDDVVCPGGVYVGNVPDDTPPTECLYFNNTIFLSMEDEPYVEEKTAIFQAAMLTKIKEGWLVDNFDLNAAMQSPPQPPTPPTSSSPPPTPNLIPNPSEGDRITTPTEPLEPDSISSGAIVGIVLAILLCFFLTVLFARKNNYGKPKNEPPRNHEDDLEMPPDGDRAMMAGAGDGDDYTVNTADKSYSSRDNLLSTSRVSSSAMAHNMSPMPELGEVSHDDLSRVDDSGRDDSEVDDSIFSAETDEHIGDVNASGMGINTSQIAAMAAASTLVASHTPTNSPPGTPSRDNLNMSQSSGSSMLSTFGSERSGFLSTEEEAGGGELNFDREGRPFDADSSGTGYAGDVGAIAAGQVATREASQDAPQAAAAVGGGGGGAVTQAAGEGGGLTAGAAVALGAAGVGVVASGAYAATRSRADPESSQESASSAGDISSIASATPSSTPSAMDDLDNAIEAGNWGHVGALAAVLASQGHGSHRRSPTHAANMSASRSIEGDSIHSGSRTSGSSSMLGASLEQSRAVEIDKLVESGDWQGVVLAAARFEADQTFDGESSFSASSASRSSRWTGSATSATTPRSMATTDRTSASNLSSQRGQAEIRAEVEALVRRVVPEEADNIDEMMTQFKGREEELVETLRRMQERAIASRARLAVQKSAKLEAKAKAAPKRSISQQSSMSQSAGMSSSAMGGASSGDHSVTSISSTKSELEQAIEAGNWQAVGAAAQRMSDQSVGELSVDEVARLREVISASPAFNQCTPSRGSMDSDFNLDSLIEQGDWTGVIAAAKSASEDRHDAPSGSDEQQHSRSMQDEQNALAQANMWQEIANQSKPEARQGPAGATDAAAWAIQRSLRAMDSNSDPNTTGETSVGNSNVSARTIHDIASESDTNGDYSQYESSSFDDSAGTGLEDYTRSGI